MQKTNVVWISHNAFLSMGNFVEVIMRAWVIRIHLNYQKSLHFNLISLVETRRHVKATFFPCLRPFRVCVLCVMDRRE